MNKNVKKKDKKSKEKPLSRGNILSITQIVFAVVLGVVTICVMRNISKTANLLYIQSDIQHRTDAVFLITDKLSSYNVLFKNPGEEEEELIRTTENNRKVAIIALLSAYEFACRQYLKRNVDRKTFEDLYGGGTLNRLLDDHEGLIRSDKCPSIREVIKQWQ